MTVPLCRCRVLYIGSAVPLQSKDGLQGIQQPLRERYPINENTETKGIDSWLSVWSNGLLLEYIDGSKKTESAFFPIITLHYCAGKCLLFWVRLVGQFSCSLREHERICDRRRGREVHTVGYAVREYSRFSASSDFCGHFSTDYRREGRAVFEHSNTSSFLGPRMPRFHLHQRTSRKCACSMLLPRVCGYDLLEDGRENPRLESHQRS